MLFLCVPWGTPSGNSSPDCASNLRGIPRTRPCGEAADITTAALGSVRAAPPLEGVEALDHDGRLQMSGGALPEQRRARHVRGGSVRLGAVCDHPLNDATFGKAGNKGSSTTKAQMLPSSSGRPPRLCGPKMHVLVRPRGGKALLLGTSELPLSESATCARGFQICGHVRKHRPCGCSGRRGPHECRNEMYLGAPCRRGHLLSKFEPRRPKFSPNWAKSVPVFPGIAHNSDIIAATILLAALRTKLGNPTTTPR